MPYASKRALPPAVKKLPSHAQSIFRKAFNAAFAEHEEEERAFKIAWGAVKRSYTKKEGRWMPKTKDAFPPAEEEEAPDVCNEDSPDYDEEACARLRSEDAFPPAETEEEEYEFEECDPDSDAYDEDECKRLKAEAAAEKPTGDSISWLETVALDRGNIRMTANGYLVAQARVARTGIQIYTGDEVGDERATVRVYRPEKTVFNRDSMHSFAHKPVTLGHPPEMVNAHNWRDYAVGHIDGEIVRDGDMIKVPMMITDAAAIKAINAGASQLSVGYDARLEIKDGVTEAGEAYDAIQHDIRVNHIALTPSARGGPKLRLGDKGKGQKMERAELGRTVTIDGIEIKLGEPNVSIVQRGLKKLRDQVIALTTENQTLSGRIAALNKQVKDSNFSDADLDKRVAERQVLVSQAQRVLGDGWQPDGKSAADIRREVVVSKLGDTATGMPDAAIEGAFTAVTANDSSSGPRELALALAKPGFGSGPKPNAEKEWEERGRFMREAWKTNNGTQARQ